MDSWLCHPNVTLGIGFVLILARIFSVWEREISNTTHGFWFWFLVCLRLQLCDVSVAIEIRIVKFHTLAYLLQHRHHHQISFFLSPFTSTSTSTQCDTCDIVALYCGPAAYSISFYFPLSHSPFCFFLLVVN